MKLQESFKWMLVPMIFDNQQLSINNVYVTYDFAFLVILIGKEFPSHKWCMKYELHPKVWLECGRKIGDDWFIKDLKLMSESDSAGSVRLCVKEVTIWEYVEIEKHICPILHNHINLGNNKLYYLLDYGNKYTENIITKKLLASSLLTVIDIYIK